MKKNSYNVQLVSMNYQVDIYDFVDFVSQIDFSKYECPTVLDYVGADYNYRIAIIDHKNKIVYLEQCEDEPYINKRVINRKDLENL